jgi:hypothetical protein
MPGAAPQGYTGQMSLGGATFTPAVDDGSFSSKLAGAEKAAQQTSQRIGQAFGRGGIAASRGGTCWTT